eukprot:scpid98296/ scgid24885/ 
MDGIFPDIEAAAVSVAAGPPSRQTEPLLWNWCTMHIFALPVHNVLAERQFNLAAIYLSPNESEASKQSSHLFVQNILHASSSSPGGAVTRAYRQASIGSMKAYCHSITPEIVEHAKKNIATRKASGDTAGQTQTSREVYSGVLDRHRLRPRQAEMVAALEVEGRGSAMTFIPPRQSAASFAAERSCPAAQRSLPSASPN